MMFLERDLKYTSEENEKLFARSKATVRAIKFMEIHPLAKILIVIDTHAADNGYFVWVGESEEDYRSCSLLEVGVVRNPMCFVI